MSSPVRIKVDTVPSEPIKINLSGPSRRQTVEVSAPIVQGRAHPYDGPYIVEPTEQEQTLETNGLKMTDNVTVEAIPSDYVGSDIPRRSSEDMSASGATVTAPAGYYESDSSKAVDNAVWRGGSRIETDPTIALDENGLITASYDLSTYISPITGSGYASRNQTYSVRVLGESTKQLPALGATTYYPSASDQTIAADQYLTGAQTIKGMDVSYDSENKILSIGVDNA